MDEPVTSNRRGNRPILLTGSHRSGSTWVGRVIASSAEVFYVHEPLNAGFAPHYLSLKGLPWYPHIHDRNAEPFQNAYGQLLSGRFPPFNARFFRPDKLFRYRLLHAVTFRCAAARKKRFLLKEPFAVFSVDWFEEQFDAQTVLLVRHPAAFVASLRAKNWPFDFNSLHSQESLLNGPLKAFRKEIEEAVDNPLDLIGQGCLLWNCVTSHIQALAQGNPDRILIRHEDLCTDPMQGYRGLFDRLGLAWSKRTARFIRRTSFRDRRDTGDPDFWFRDSQAVAQNWKARLTTPEIRRIHDATRPVWMQFYRDSDWES